MEHYVLDDDGNHRQATLMEWARWFETGRSKHQVVTWVWPYRISTVFLGIDHSFQDGPHVPILWETMVFSWWNKLRLRRPIYLDGKRVFGWATHSGDDVDCYRAANRARAMVHHRKCVRIARWARFVGWEMGTKIAGRRHGNQAD